MPRKAIPHLKFQLRLESNAPSPEVLLSVMSSRTIGGGVLPKINTFVLLVMFGRTAATFHRLLRESACAAQTLGRGLHDHRKCSRGQL